MTEGTDHSEAAGNRLSWVLVAVLAALAAAFTLLDGGAQTAAVAATLLAGLAGIAWASATPRKDS